jgi:maltose O-acetyltransferase
MFVNDRTFWVLQNVLKYLPFNWARALRSWLYRPFFRSCGDHVLIEDGVTIKYPSYIDIGAYTVINQNCFLVGLGGLRIGRDVMMGNNSSIITTTHVTDSLDTPMRLQGMKTEPTTVGDDVWIGTRAAILAGAHVGDHSIIGAGAVVLGRKYPSYAVLGGVPARVLELRTAAGPQRASTAE